MEPSQTGAVGYGGPYHTIFFMRGLRARPSGATMAGGAAGGWLRRWSTPSPACGREPAMLAESDIRDLLARARTIAVVGLSDHPYRDSYGIAGFLQRSGYRVLPVNPNLHEPVLGQRPYASLRDIAEPVDIVNVFRRSEYVAGVVEDAIAIHADAIWTQSGIEDLAAAQRAEAAGLKVVMNRCIAVTYRLLL